MKWSKALAGKKHHEVWRGHVAENIILPMAVHMYSVLCSERPAHVNLTGFLYKPSDFTHCLAYCVAYQEKRLVFPPAPDPHLPCYTTIST